MKLLGLALGAMAVCLLVLPLLVLAVLATHPWLAPGALLGAPRVTVTGPPAIGRPGGVPADQWALMLLAAAGAPCVVRPEDLAAIAQTESDFGRHLLNPRSGAFGYGQFDAATWAAFGSGDPNNPADALPAMARVLCARGYATHRVAALNSYGGCVTPLCLGASDYATLIDRLARGFLAASDVLDVARSWLGVRYVFGGTSRAGIDCSALVQQVFAAVGVRLPRTAQQQFDSVAHLSRDQLQPGDLVFFEHTYASPDRITHVGIYLGDGQQINAPTEGQTVSVQPVFSGFWGQHFAGAGRPGR
jgi:cell wall-associated NlpC family hydrolase